MVIIFSLLLLIFLAAFFGLESFAVNIMEASDVRILGYSILTPEFRGFLGIGAIFCEVVIISLALLDRIGETIMAAIKPIARLIPLGVFIGSAWKTLSPIVLNLLPPNVAAATGFVQDPAYISTAVTTGGLADGILLTLGTMLLFAITTYALDKRQESTQIRNLKREVERLRRAI